MGANFTGPKDESSSKNSRRHTPHQNTVPTCLTIECELSTVYIAIAEENGHPERKSAYDEECCSQCRTYAKLGIKKSNTTPQSELDVNRISYQDEYWLLKAHDGFQCRLHQHCRPLGTE